MKIDASQAPSRSVQALLELRQEPVRPMAAGMLLHYTGSTDSAMPVLLEDMAIVSALEEIFAPRV